MKLFKSAALSALLGLVCALVLLLVFSLFLKNAGDPAALIDPFSLAAAVLSGALAGLCSAKMQKDEGIFPALLAGVLLSLAVLLLSFIPGGRKTLFGSLLRPALVILSALCAGILYVRLAKKSGGKRKRRKRRN